MSVGLAELLSEFGGCGGFGNWLSLPGCPMLIVEVDGMIHQAPISESPVYDDFRWTIPADVLYEAGGKRVAEVRVIGEEPVRVGENVDWICLNAKGVGLFRVWYKGAYGVKLAEAIARAKLDRIAVERIKNDVVEIVGLGLAPESLIDQFDARARTRQVYGHVLGRIDPDSGWRLSRFRIS
jgi:hypothetical protein